MMSSTKFLITIEHVWLKSINQRKLENIQNCAKVLTQNYSNAAYTTRYADYDHIQVSAPFNHVLHVELNRPEVNNAINREMFREISTCFNEIASDKQCRAVVISGNGKLFCSGIDVDDFIQMITFGSSKEFSQRDDVASRAKFIRQMITMYQNSFSSIVKCQKPVISAVHSSCLGAGVDLIAATDIRYASKDSHFTLSHTSLGMTTNLGSLQRLPKIVGNESVIREMALTGRKVFAKEAKETGLIGKIFENFERCLEGALKIAQLIASNSPVAVQGTKQALNYSRNHSDKEGLEYMQIFNMSMLQSEDAIIAIKSLMSKQKNPKFYDF